MGWTFYNSTGAKLSSTSTVVVDITTLDIDGATALSGAVADADLFIVDDAGGGDNRKVTGATLKTYAGTAAIQLLQMHAYVTADASLQTPHHNVNTCSDNGTGKYLFDFDDDFDSGIFTILGMAGAGSGGIISFDGRAGSSLSVETWEVSGSQADKEFGVAMAGVLA